MTLAVDPHMEPILARLRAAPPLDYETMPIGEARATFLALAAYWNSDLPEVASVRALSLPGPAGAIPAELFTPPDSLDALIVHLHGGGWTFGAVASHQGAVRRLALASRCPVLSIDYRLAPEHPFPAGLDDALAAIRFAEEGGLGPPVPATRMALAGDSAGANLAYAAMLARRDSGLAVPATAALFYGCFAPDFSLPSHARCGDGTFGLGSKRMNWFWRNYLGLEGFATTALAAPLRADPSGLPPLYLNAAGLDPLLDDTLALAAKLASAGVGYRLDVFPGVIHGFMQMSQELPAARAASLAAGRYIEAVFEREAGR